MKKALTILVLIISSTICCVCQTIEGTMIIMAICKDGILIASDSRGVIAENFVDLAYIDEKNKSFEVQNRVIAFAGRSYMWNDPLSKFLTLIPNNQFPVLIEDEIQFFINYVIKNGDSRGKVNFLSQTIILMAGYEGNQPVICKADKGFRNTICNEMVASNMIIPESLKNLFANCTMEQGIQVLNGVYQSNTLINVGGPIKIWGIDNISHKPRCLQNCYDYENRSLTNYYKAILENKINYTLIDTCSDQYFKKYISRELNRIN